MSILSDNGVWMIYGGTSGEMHGPFDNHGECDMFNLLVKLGLA